MPFGQPVRPESRPSDETRHRMAVPFRDDGLTAATALPSVRRRQQCGHHEPKEHEHRDGRQCGEAGEIADPEPAHWSTDLKNQVIPPAKDDQKHQEAPDTCQNVLSRQ